MICLRGERRLRVPPYDGVVQVVREVDGNISLGGAGDVVNPSPSRMRRLRTALLEHPERASRPGCGQRCGAQAVGLYGSKEEVVVERILDEVHRARLHRPDGQCDVAVASHDDASARDSGVAATRTKLESLSRR